MQGGTRGQKGCGKGKAQRAMCATHALQVCSALMLSRGRVKRYAPARFMSCGGMLNARPYYKMFYGCSEQRLGAPVINCNEIGSDDMSHDPCLR